MALIAAPEPFSTPLGVGLLAASWLISRSQESQKQAYLKHILTEYLHTYRPFGYGISQDSSAKVQQHVWAREPIAEKRSRTAFGPVPNTVHTNYYQPRREPEVVHHTLDWDRVIKRVDTGGQRRGFEGFWGAGTRLDTKVVRHEFKRGFAMASAAN